MSQHSSANLQDARAEALLATIIMAREAAEFLRRSISHTPAEGVSILAGDFSPSSLDSAKFVLEHAPALITALHSR